MFFKLPTGCFGVYMKAKFIVKDAKSLSNIGISLQNGEDDKYSFISFVVLSINLHTFLSN